MSLKFPFGFYIYCGKEKQKEYIPHLTVAGIKTGTVLTQGFDGDLNGKIKRK